MCISANSLNLLLHATSASFASAILSSSSSLFSLACQMQFEINLFHQKSTPRQTVHKELISAVYDCMALQEYFGENGKKITERSIYSRKKLFTRQQTGQVGLLSIHSYIQLRW
jgi:hypothetical protein